jgi:hypothetical protein
MKDLRVGQPLWFYAGGHETVMHSDQPLLAFVTYVHSHRHVDAKASPLVNLAVFGKEGSLWQRPSVHVWDGEGDVPERGSYARWQEDDEAEEKRAEAANAPKRAFGETEEAHKARVEKWRSEPDAMPARATGESDDGYRARVAMWQSEHMDDRRIKQAAMDARNNMDHGPPAPGLPNPALQGTQWDTEAQARDAKVKADKDAADARATAAKNQAAVKPKTQAESDQASYKKWHDEQQARAEAAQQDGG